MNAIHAEITIGVTELRESPTRILKRAEDENQAVAINIHLYFRVVQNLRLPSI